MQNSGYRPITTEKFLDILKVLGLYNENDSSKNAQILCHGPGHRGIANLNNILTEEGLLIIRNFEGSDNYVARGLQSTNALMNNEGDNSIDIERILSYSYGRVDENGFRYNIISAIPQEIQDIVLGRIMGDRKSGNCCILDDLNIPVIPPQFILGIERTDTINRKTEFLLNDNFYALSKENESLAVNFVENLFKERKISVEDYFKGIEYHIMFERERERRNLSKPQPKGYKEHAYKLYKEGIQGEQEKPEGGTIKNLEETSQSTIVRRPGEFWVTSSDPETAARFSDETQKKIDQEFLKQQAERDFIDAFINQIPETEKPKSIVKPIIGDSSRLEQTVSDPSKTNLSANIVKSKNGYYSLSFNYLNQAQQQEVRGIVEKLIDSFGANSQWQKNGGKYIMPKLMSVEEEHTTSAVESMLVPKELVSTITKQFVEENNFVISAGDQKLAGQFSDDSYKKMMSELRPEVDIRQSREGLFLLHFNNRNSEQQQAVKDITQDLLKTYGGDSQWVKDGGEQINLVYAVNTDGEGNMKIDYNCVEYMYVPEELLKPITEQFVNDDGMIVSSESFQLKDEFNEDEYNDMLDSIFKQQDNLFPVQEDPGQEQ